MIMNSPNSISGWPVYDVNSVIKVIKTSLNRERFAFGQEHRLINSEVTAESIAKLSEHLQSTLSDGEPDDLLVVTIAGHGKKDEKSGEFIYMASDGNSNKEIGWSAFATLASNVPCRKLFLIDVCHSGAAATKESFYALGAESVAVVAAAADDEFSFEPPPIKEQDFRNEYKDVRMENGTFTHFLIAGFKGNADGFRKNGSVGETDGNVQLEEAVYYTTNSVPTFVERAYDYNLSQKSQTPQFYPRNLAGLGTLSLTRYLSWKPRVILPKP